MARYTGNPPATVTVDGIDLVPGAEFTWGDASAGARLLSVALLMSALGNDIEAKKYRDRFMWRRVKTWSKTMPWTITTQEIVAIVDDMKETEATASRAVRQVAAEPITREHEGGIGVSGAPIRWTKTEKT